MKKLETILSIAFIAFTLTTAFITGQVSRQPEINQLIDEAARLRTIPPAAGIALWIPCPVGAEDVALDTVDCEKRAAEIVTVRQRPVRPAIRIVPCTTDSDCEEKNGGEY